MTHKNPSKVGIKSHRTVHLQSHCVRFNGLCLVYSGPLINIPFTLANLPTI